MTALAAKREIYPARVKKDFTVRVKGGVIIYPGAKVAMKSGLLQPIDESTGLKHFCTATNTATVDNSGGADGDLSCNIEFDDPKTLIYCQNDGTAPITSSDIGKDAYAVDDSGVVSADGDGRTRLGTPWILVSSTDSLGQRPGVYVEAEGVLSDILQSLQGTGEIVLAPDNFCLLTGAPLALFSNGASAVPGLAIVDSKAKAVRWNNNATLDGILASFGMPSDCDITENMIVQIRASKTGATLADAPTFVVGAYNQVIGALHDADADFGGTSSAMTGDAVAKTIQVVTQRLAAANLAASPASVTMSIKPTDGTLGTDDLVLHSVRIIYTKKLLTS